MKRLYRHEYGRLIHTQVYILLICCSRVMPVSTSTARLYQTIYACALPGIGDGQCICRVQYALFLQRYDELITGRSPCALICTPLLHTTSVHFSVRCVQLFSVCLYMRPRTAGAPSFMVSLTSQWFECPHPYCDVLSRGLLSAMRMDTALI